MTLPSRLDDTVPVGGPPTAAGELRCAGATHPGLARERNEDRLLVDPARGLLVVVDGMGGEAAGDVAAETALAALVTRLQRPSGTAEERIREAIALANNRIVALARENPAWQGMGCVVTVAVIEGGRVTAGHVGDSRLYRLSGGRIQKMTRDHSPVGALEDAGEISESEAMRHPGRNEVYRSLGQSELDPRDREFVELVRFPLEPGESILLCSDGLSDLVPAADIARIARTHAGDPQRLVNALVAEANAAGGKDNVTVAFALRERRSGAGARERARTAGVPAGAGAVGRGLAGRLRRPSTMFVLGALAGILLYAAFSLVARDRPSSLVPSALQPAGPRLLEVGPGLRYSTLADALEAARAGDTLRVAPGRYAEQVQLEEGVTLMARVPGETVLAPLPDGTGRAAALVIEGLTAGRVSGLAIESGGAPLEVGIRIRNSRVALDQVTVRGAGIAAISIEGGAPTVTACTLRDNPGAGIAVRAGATPRLSHNLVLDNGAAGIEVEEGARPEIAGNVIAGNAAGGIRGLPGALRAAALEANAFVAFGRANRRGAIVAAPRAAAPNPATPASRGRP